jgi:excinuclease ABC, A subunit
MDKKEGLRLNADLQSSSSQTHLSESEQELWAMGAIEVHGAREHNLKNVDVSLPRHKLTVVTGLSGSGKSSLAFDTLLAEGQRRYLDTFSSYARSFIGGGGGRPDVDEIVGLSPVVAIEQKSASTNPRSTVGTVTEIYDYLRILYARVGTPYSYRTGKEMMRYTEEQVIDHVMEQYADDSIYILAPIVVDRKGHYRELFEQMRRRGFLHAYIDGQICELTPGMKLNRFSRHYVSIMVDKCTVKKPNKQRIADAVAIAMKLGDGVLDIMRRDSEELQHLSKKLMDPESGIAYPDASPADFSFNSPRGYCKRCKGLGRVGVLDIDKVISSPSSSIRDGAIIPIGSYRKRSVLFTSIEKILAEHGCTIDTPFDQIPEEAVEQIFFGIDSDGEFGDEEESSFTFEGVSQYVRNLAEDEDATASMRSWAEAFLSERVCPACGGHRLNPIALSYRLAGDTIADLAELELDHLAVRLREIEDRLTDNQQKVAHEVIKEILLRVTFLLDVGLYYLTLSRPSVSLSGGESQRIRLATQIGTGLVEVLYILDEPGIGLHQRDNRMLIDALKKLRNAQNTVLVVEHDRDMMLAADYLIDMGPGAGRLGGHVIYQGAPSEIGDTHTQTCDYLMNRLFIPLPENYRQPISDRYIKLNGCTGNNLKDVSVSIPLGLFVCITGVSGSGKSSLINGTLVPILSQHLYHSKQTPLPYSSVEGLDLIDKIAFVDQSPLGRTPRSNPATYTGLFGEIRNLFVKVPESRARGYKPGRFSFNVKEGRCEECRGNGYKTISMNFLPDVTIPCGVCRGKRYNRETLEIRYKGKSIADVLDMTFNQAAEFFEHIPTLHRKLSTLQRVGLGYVKLGQPSTTLSGGESQRVKLATELSKRDTGRTLYVLDEPTTGLHFEDIRVLLKLVNELVDRGNTVLIIEHNLDVIKSADYVIDMGPEGGRNGGEIIFSGSPLEMIQIPDTQSYTAQYLKEEMQRTPTNVSNEETVAS